MPACPACSYFRKANPADPFAGWRVLSSKIFELRSKWEKHLAERAMWEQQRFESGLPFEFEPLAYPYCEYFTKKTGFNSAGSPVRYWLCADKNADDNCKEFVAAKENAEEMKNNEG
jgi:hypothetical protein